MMSIEEKAIWVAAYISARGPTNLMRNAVASAWEAVADARTFAKTASASDTSEALAMLREMVGEEAGTVPVVSLAQQFAAVPRWDEEDDGASGGVWMEEQPEGKYLLREDVLALAQKLDAGRVKADPLAAVRKHVREYGEPVKYEPWTQDDLAWFEKLRELVGAER